MKIHRLVFSPIDVNTYILEDESGVCAIIDCGCYDESETRELEGFLEGHNLKPVLLLNTHSHLDHIFGNKFMLERYSLRTLAGELDEMNRRMAVQHAELFGMSMEEPPETGGFIADNQLLHFGDTELKSIFVPGHTSGSIAFWCEKDNCVFTGDALFAGSIGRTDLPGGDFDTLIRSIKTRLFTLPTSTIVYPGHGKETNIMAEMKYNPYFS